MSVRAKDREDRTREGLLAEIEELKKRLREKEETLRALRNGERDARGVARPGGETVFSSEGEDRAYRALLESIEEGAGILSSDGIVLYCNRRFAEMVQHPPEKVMGERISRFLGPADHATLEALLGKGLEGESARGELDLRAAGEHAFSSVLVSCRSLHTADLRGVCVVFADLSERKRNEAALQEAYEGRKALQDQMKQQAADLDRKNVALRELIGQITLEKNRIKEDVAANIRETVLPILEKFRVEEKFAPHVKAIRRLLEDLTSSYGRELTGIGSTLTLKEMDICRMIRGGLTSKEIAEALYVSVQTVEKHRKNIRRKLGIANKAVDLGSFLNSR